MDAKLSLERLVCVSLEGPWVDSVEKRGGTQVKVRAVGWKEVAL